MSLTQYLTATPKHKCQHRTQIAFRHFWPLYRFTREKWEQVRPESEEDDFFAVNTFSLFPSHVTELLDRCEEICTAHKKYGKRGCRKDIEVAFQLLPEDNRVDVLIEADYDDSYFEHVKRLRDFLKKHFLKDKTILWERG